MERMGRWLQEKFGPTALELVKSVFVSMASFLCDYLILFLLTSGFGLHHLASNVVSYVLGWTLNYLLSNRLVFKQHRFQKRLVEILLTAAIVAAGFGLNELFLWIFTDLLRLFYMLSKIAAGRVDLFLQLFSAQIPSLRQ